MSSLEVTNSTFVYGYSEGKIVPEFGLVILTALIAFLVQFGFAVQVGRSRKKFGIQPPRMTETIIDEGSGLSNAGTVPEEYMRYQRVHLNNVENSAFFYALLFTAGLGYPFGAFLAGLVYQLGRVVTAIGYYRSTETRQWGSFFHLGEFTLFGLALATAIQLLKRSG
eukprot:TRINITY_DN2320_c0_g1_i7.p1 TRINITY_DN2320_c0_g1~~TRINITY_DN2320_c0_g1_i7.p1  ORF type:complete len:190 (+),score=18.91 TRINITY_DN2320_c0_g1_i7:71-571(+)